MLYDHFFLYEILLVFGTRITSYISLRGKYRFLLSLYSPYLLKRRLQLSDQGTSTSVGAQGGSTELPPRKPLRHIYIFTQSRRT